MSATADTPAGRADPAQLTVLYSRNDDGWITAQIAEYPAAISQGRTEHEAWTNVLDALHDLTHEPTATERAAAFVQARVVEPLDGLLGILVIVLMGGLVWALWMIVRRSRTRPRQTVSALDARIASVTGPSAEPRLWSCGCCGMRCIYRSGDTSPGQVSASPDGFTPGSGQRFVPWNEVDEIEVAYHQSAYTEEHGLVLKLRCDPSVASRVVTTNGANPDRIDVSLDGLFSGLAGPRRRRGRHFRSPGSADAGVGVWLEQPIRRR